MRMAGHFDHVLQEARRRTPLRERHRQMSRARRGCPAHSRPETASRRALRPAGHSWRGHPGRSGRRWQAAYRGAAPSRPALPPTRSSRWRLNSPGLSGSKPRWISVICAISIRCSHPASSALDGGWRGRSLAAGSMAVSSARLLALVCRFPRFAAIHVVFVAHCAARCDRFLDRYRGKFGPAFAHMARTAAARAFKARDQHCISVVRCGRFHVASWHNRTCGGLCDRTSPCCSSVRSARLCCTVKPAVAAPPPLLTLWQS